MNIDDIKEKIRNVPDFPRKGIMFRDITTLLKDRSAMKYVMDKMADHYANKSIDIVASVESRGFIFGSTLAYILGAGFVPIRKKGKLPSETKSISYNLEYGTDELEIHKDAIHSGEKVLLVDDLLATGGTISAAADLVKQLGGDIVGFCFLIESSELKGRNKIKGSEIFSLIKCE